MQVLLELGVQKYGEVFADRPEALRQHGCGIGADNHPIAVGNVDIEQSIADCAADKVNLHGVEAV